MKEQGPGHTAQGGTAQSDCLVPDETAAPGGGGSGPVTREHVRELLEAPAQGSILVLLEGRARVVPAADLGSDRYAGALEVVGSEEISGRATSGSSRTEEELDALAATLNTMVAKLGA